MGQVFLSYASADRERARRLAEAMQGKGYQVFTPKKVSAGESLLRSMGERGAEQRCVQLCKGARLTYKGWSGSDNSCTCDF